MKRFARGGMVVAGALALLLAGCPWFVPQGRWNPGDPLYEASTDPNDQAGQVPVSPSQLAIAADRPARLLLSWADNSDHEQGFLIQREIGNTGTYEDIATLTDNLTEYGDGTVTPLAEYTYRLRAFNAEGQSAWTPEISAVAAPALSGLVSSAGALSPAFASDRIAYTLEVGNSVSSLTLTPTAAVNAIDITVNGVATQSSVASAAVTVELGQTQIPVVLTPVDVAAATVTYTVVVNRLTGASANADLASLTTSDGVLSPTFDPAVSAYAVTLPGSVSSISVTPTAAGSGATIAVNGSAVSSGAASPAISLATGSATITMVVTAADGATTRTYTIDATQTDANADLSALSISAGTLVPGFDSAVGAYAVTVDEAVVSVTVTPTVADAGSTVTVNASPVASGVASQAISLGSGSATVTIVVTASDGLSSRTYTIEVSQVSSNADLSSLTVSAGTLIPTFSAAVTSYTAATPSGTSSVTVTPTAAGTGATLTVNGSGVASGTASPAFAIVPGSATPISIVVTAESGATKTYSIDALIQVAAPSFGVPGGTYSTERQVAITTTPPAAQIRYTTDGTTPSSSYGLVYTGQVPISATTTLKAIGYAGGWADSAVSTAQYVFVPSGSRDATFGSDGIVITPVLSANDYATDVAVQPDGKIVVVGYSSNGTNNDIVVVRYNADGSLDTGFGIGGKIVKDFGVGHDQAYAVAIFGGKIAVGGSRYRTASSDDIVVLRYLDDGTPDPDFGVSGVADLIVDTVSDTALGMTVQTDGKIVVVGHLHQSNEDFVVARFNANGSVDTTFDSDGWVRTDIASGRDYGRAVAIQTNGSIVCAGYGEIGGINTISVIRLLSGGGLDNTFDADGKVTTSFGASGYGLDLALQTDGKIVVSGYVYNVDHFELVVLRYLAGGGLDTGFSGDGWVRAPAGTSSFGLQMALQSTGEIVVAGYTNSGADDDFLVVRFDTDGNLDTGFDADGKVVTAITATEDWARAVAVDGDGKLIVAGTSHNGTNRDLAVVRYWP